MLGKHCDEIDLSVDNLKSDDNPESVKINPLKLTKGIALEVFLYAKAHCTNPIS